MIRKGISHKVYNIWTANAALKELGVQFTRCPDSAFYMVLDAAMVDRKALLDWSKSTRDVNNDALVVTDAWVRSMIRTGEWVDAMGYLHSLHFPQTPTTESPLPPSMPTLSSPPPQTAPSRPPNTWQPPREKFACQAKPADAVPNLNPHLSDVFDQLAIEYEVKAKGPLPDQMRQRTYRIVAKILKELDYLVTEENAAGLKRLKGFGSGVMEKILQILQLGVCRKLDAIQRDPIEESIKLFCKIWGVGPKSARDLYHVHGCRSIEDVRSKAQGALSARQKVGLQYYEELLQRIPRDEVERIFGTVLAAAQSLNPYVSCYVCGSYRRGRPNSGDIDILISYPTRLDMSVSGMGIKANAAIALDDRAGKVVWGGVGARLSPESYSENQSIDSIERDRSENFLQQLLRLLKDKGVLTDHLAGHRGEEDAWKFGTSFDGTVEHRTSYMGIGVDISQGSVALHRRIDIKVYSPYQLPYALLYFTGCDLFNRSMRLYAKRLKRPGAPLGYSLNDRGMFPKLGYRYDNNETINGPLVVCKDERGVMEFLGLAWMEPFERTGGVVENGGESTMKSETERGGKAEDLVHAGEEDCEAVDSYCGAEEHVPSWR